MKTGDKEVTASHVAMLLNEQPMFFIHSFIHLLNMLAKEILARFVILVTISVLHL